MTDLQSWAFEILKVLFSGLSGQSPSKAHDKVPRRATRLRHAMHGGYKCFGLNKIQEIHRIHNEYYSMPVNREENETRSGNAAF